MKSAWFTVLEREAGLGQQVLAELHRYGLASEGHLWIDDLAPWHGWRVGKDVRKSARHR